MSNGRVHEFSHSYASLFLQMYPNYVLTQFTYNKLRVEHMLFMGSEKFPGDHEYDEYLAKVRFRLPFRFHLN